MPGNSASRLLGDQVLERDERRAVAGRDEARQHLLRDLHARERLDARQRVAHDHGERQRQVGDVGERPPEARRPAASGPGRSGGGSARRARAAPRPPTSSTPTMRMPCSASCGPQLLLQAAALARDALAVHPADRVDRLGRRAAVGSGSSMPASTWSCRPATRTMKNSSRLAAKIAQNFTRSSSGTSGSSASSSTRSLKSQPGQLAVEVQLGGVEVDAALRRPRVRGRRVDRVRLATRAGRLDRNAPSPDAPARSPTAYSSRARKPLRSSSLPELQEAREEQLAARAQVHEQRHQAARRSCGAAPGARAPGRGPRRPRRRRPARARPRPRSSSRIALHLAGSDVAVVDLAEQVLERPWPACAPAGGVVRRSIGAVISST